MWTEDPAQPCPKRQAGRRMHSDGHRPPQESAGLPKSGAPSFPHSTTGQHLPKATALGPLRHQRSWGVTAPALRHCSFCAGEPRTLGTPPTSCSGTGLSPLSLRARLRTGSQDHPSWGCRTTLTRALSSQGLILTAARKGTPHYCDRVSPTPRNLRKQEPGPGQ